jgi:hypothetical protein
MLVKFPTRYRVLEQLGLDYPNRRVCIDKQLRQIEGNIATLRRARAALLAEYREELRRELDAMTE